MLIYVMSQQYNGLIMELYTNYTKCLRFLKMHLPSIFVLRYNCYRVKMIVHSFMIKLDQLDY